MMTNILPISLPVEPEPLKQNQAILIPSGDSRQHRNRTTWPAQNRLESRLQRVFAGRRISLQRALPYDPQLGHGFITSQRMGMDVFQHIHPEAPLVVAIAAWQYSHHILAGLRDHRGPILTIANWSGEWPGLVGLLGLNACLTKIGKPFSSLWSENFNDRFFLDGIRQWWEVGRVAHNTSHVRAYDASEVAVDDGQIGHILAEQLLRQKAVIGVFDEGCMGMSNAIVEDELLNPLGIYKERLSQSALLAAMQPVTDLQAREIRAWLERRGMRFCSGSDPATELTDGQILEQCKMYIAAIRMAHEFGCAAIGIQYQQGLKDMAPASDLVEGLLNNPDRPPVFHPVSGEELYPNQALPHFNEVDECAAIDLLVTNRVWTTLRLDPSATLHDIRWGEWYQDSRMEAFVWVLMISGAVPASHLVGGYAGASSQRQPPAGFPAGGGTLTGVCKPGDFVWSRIFIEDGRLQADLGLGQAVELPPAETARRLQATTPVWPILHAVLENVARDQLMARHRSNHITIAYGQDRPTAQRALAIKSAMLANLGIEVHWCGV